MAKDKKLVSEITSMDEDFAQWYTDICKKAELIEYTSVKGCMVRLRYMGEYSENSRQYVQGNRSRECMYAYVHSREPAPEGKRPR